MPKYLLALALGAGLLSACAPTAATQHAPVTIANHPKWAVKGTMPDGSDILQPLTLQHPTEPFSGIQTYISGNVKVNVAKYDPATVQSTLPDGTPYGCLLTMQGKGYSGVMVRGEQAGQLEDMLRLSELQGGDTDLLTVAGIRRRLGRTPQAEALLGTCELTPQ